MFIFNIFFYYQMLILSLQFGNKLINVKKYVENEHEMLSFVYGTTMCI